MFTGAPCSCRFGVLRCADCNRNELLRLQAQRIKESGDPTALIPLALRQFFSDQELFERGQRALHEEAKRR